MAGMMLVMIVDGEVVCNKRGEARIYSSYKSLQAAMRRLGIKHADIGTINFHTGITLKRI